MTHISANSKQFASSTLHFQIHCLFVLLSAGEHGKLGHGNNTTQKTPVMIAGLNGVVIRQVACGNRHSAAVSSDSDLYTWGDGEYGKLGTVYMYNNYTCMYM